MKDDEFWKMMNIAAKAIRRQQAKDELEWFEKKIAVTKLLKANRIIFGNEADQAAIVNAKDGKIIPLE